MFEEIIASKELKFNDLEKKVYRFICFIGCLIIKLILESYDRKNFSIKITRFCVQKLDIDSQV